MPANVAHLPQQLWHRLRERRAVSSNPHVSADITRRASIASSIKRNAVACNSEVKSTHKAGVNQPKAKRNGK